MNISRKILRNFRQSGKFVAYSSRVKNKMWIVDGWIKKDISLSKEYEKSGAVIRNFYPRLFLFRIKIWTQKYKR